MRSILYLGLASGLLAASPALAKPVSHHAGPQHATGFTASGAQILARDSNGRASKLLVDGQVYAVCSATVTDSCINPRQAGLDFGNRPLASWPGHPASEAD